MSDKKVIYVIGSGILPHTVHAIAHHLPAHVIVNTSKTRDAGKPQHAKVQIPFLRKHC